MKMDNQPNPTRAFKGVWIPAEIWDSEELTWMEKCLLAEVNSLDDGNGCWAGNDFLAAKFKTTAGSIANMISKLRSSGFLKTVKFDGRTRWISVSDTLVSILKQGSPSGEVSVHQTVKSKEPCYIEEKQVESSSCEKREKRPELSPKQPTAVSEPPKPRERNILLDALATIDGSDVAQITQTQWGRAAKALSGIKNVCPEVTPNEIFRRAENYRRHFEGAAITSTALEANWAKCDRPPVVVKRNKGPNI
jgi:hypothetical protein